MDNEKSDNRAYNSLKNIADRQPCPRCLGEGFKHEVYYPKHTHLRCKHDSVCVGCQGSGIVINKTACLSCNSFGYFHPASSFRNHHDDPTVPCSDCVGCIDCNSTGVVDRSFIKEKTLLEDMRAYFDKEESLRPLPFINPLSFINPSLIKTNQSTNQSQPNQSIDSNETNTDILPKYYSEIHPHLMTDSIKLSFSKGEKTPETLLIPLKNEPSPIKEQKILCPRCHGKSKIHQSALKHESKNCKHCVVCKACNGKSYVIDKIPCLECKGCGSIHDSKEEHLAPFGLRCFYCKTCNGCDGLGVVDGRLIERESGSFDTSATTLVEGIY